MKIIQLAGLALLILCGSRAAAGQSAPAPSAAPVASENLAQEAADPAAPLMAFNFKGNLCRYPLRIPGTANALFFQAGHSVPGVETEQSAANDTDLQREWTDHRERSGQYLHL